jgi:outer membrane protein OmpA-like peptidoglycan-associated protein
VTFVGHEDEIGDPARFNDKGRQRAQAVAEALKKKMDKMWDRLPAASRPKGRLIFVVSTEGPRRPIRSNVTEQGRALNRRVEVTARRPEFCRDLA